MSRHTAEAFVKAWLAAANIREVAAALDIAECAAYQRASRYRKAGVRLPKFKTVYVGRKTLDTAALNALIDSAEAK